MTAGVWSRILESIDKFGAAATVTMTAAAGSTPRDAGARMVVQPDGGFTGSIGGGALEWEATAIARGLIAGERPGTVTLLSFALGPDLGQCCGGRADMAVITYGPDDRERVAALAKREALDRAFWTQATLDRNGSPTRSVIDAPPAGTPAALIRDGVLIERFGDEPRPLFLFGAGHVGRALVLALAPLPFAVTWVDPRADAFPEFLPANTRAVHQDPPEAALAVAPEGAFVLAMTHSHPLDFAVVHAALAAGRFPYVGVIGSATKRARFTKQLRAAGIAEDRIANLVCPIGLVAIKSKMPAVIAAGTAAELLLRDEQASAANASSPPVALVRTG